MASTRMDSLDLRHAVASCLAHGIGHPVRGRIGGVQYGICTERGRLGRVRGRIFIGMGVFRVSRTAVIEAALKQLTMEMLKGRVSTVLLCISSRRATQNLSKTHVPGRRVISG